MFLSAPVRTSSTPSQARSRLASRARTAALAATLAGLLATPLAFAQADDYSEVSRLVRAGQLNEALGKADQYLAGKPRDPQMRFLKGVIQTESGKPTEAIATFAKLTEDFPELPEPYNNLAVLYASQSQFDKARAALEMAIRTNPSYATAHENLGDVYAKLASQAYSKALQLDGGNAAVAPKLSLIRSLFAPDSRASRPAPVAAAPSPAPAPAAPPKAAPAPTAVAPAPAPVAASPAPAPSAPAPAPAPAQAGKSEVEAAVRAWASAWSSKNMNGYLGAYAPSFKPPSGQSRSAWEADRRARIMPRSRIEVGISDLVVTVDGGQASARFRQAYNSDNLNVTSRKRLDLVKSGNRWLITREATGT